MKRLAEFILVALLLNTNAHGQGTNRHGMNLSMGRYRNDGGNPTSLGSLISHKFCVRGPPSPNLPTETTGQSTQTLSALQISSATSLCRHTIPL